MKKWWTWIVGAIAALGAMLLFERSKRKSAEALVSNLEVKEKALDLDRRGLDQAAKLAEEEANRKSAWQKLNEDKTHELSPNEMVEFIRDPDNRG